jgi:hypothetical protein
MESGKAFATSRSSNTTLAAPHPGRAWQQPDESFDGEAELESELARGHEIAESFVLAQKCAGRDEDWLAAEASTAVTLIPRRANDFD